MKRALILAVGRIKEPALRDLCQDYYLRCRRLLVVEERELRDDRALEQAVPRRGVVVALDERGTQSDSRQLAAQLGRWLEETAGEVVFVIGGPDGLPPAVRARADALLSLSRLTFGHRLARVVFAEQLYRAVSIILGLPYHR